MRCSGARFEQVARRLRCSSVLLTWHVAAQHSRVCALGHAIANDCRLSRNERLVKLLSVLRSLLRSESALHRASLSTVPPVASRRRSRRAPLTPAPLAQLDIESPSATTTAALAAIEVRCPPRSTRFAQRLAQEPSTLVSTLDAAVRAALTLPFGAAVRCACASRAGTPTDGAAGGAAGRRRVVAPLARRARHAVAGDDARRLVRSVGGRGFVRWRFDAPLNRARHSMCELLEARSASGER